MTQEQHAADLDAEGTILGAIIGDNRHLPALPSRLTPEAFFSEAHRQIFAAMATLRDERTDVTVETVAHELKRANRLQQVGGREYLVQLEDFAPVQTPAMMARVCRIVIDKAAQRKALVALGQWQARLVDPSCDVQDALGGLERELQGIATSTGVQGGLKPIREPLRAELAEWHERAVGRGTPGIPTGFREYDQTYGGLHRGDFKVVAARPGMGKTSYVTGIAINVAKRDEAVALFSLEMPARQMAGRMLCTEAGIALGKTRAGRLSPRELTQTTVAVGSLGDLPLYIDDASSGRPYAADIVSRSRQLASELARQGKRLALIIVDYLQIVRLREALLKQRQDLAVGEVSTTLMQLAKELDCAVIAVAQLNRGVESRDNKRPTMSDLRDSGQIEQDATQIEMLYRDEYYDPETRDPGIVEVIIEKARHGPTGTIKLRFDGPTTRFENLEASMYEAAE
jgi:replicative DNA helicase